VPIDYHVRDAMLKYYQRHMPKLAISFGTKTPFYGRYRMICFTVHWFWSCVTATGEHWYCEHCLNTE